MADASVAGAVSDGISMGTEGMSYSLQSRDLIADSIETIMGAQWYDGLVALPGCAAFSDEAPGSADGVHVATAFYPLQ